VFLLLVTDMLAHILDYEAGSDEERSDDDQKSLQVYAWSILRILVRVFSRPLR